MGFEKIARETFVKSTTSINWTDEEEVKFIYDLAKSFKDNYIASYKYNMEHGPEEDPRDLIESLAEELSFFQALTTALNRKIERITQIISGKGQDRSLKAN